MQSSKQKLKELGAFRNEVVGGSVAPYWKRVWMQSIICMTAWTRLALTSNSQHIIQSAGVLCVHALVSYHGEQRKQCAPHKCRMHVAREFLYLLHESSDILLFFPVKSTWLESWVPLWFGLSVKLKNPTFLFFYKRVVLTHEIAACCLFMWEML